jgi:hypothetical protein
LGAAEFGGPFFIDHSFRNRSGKLGSPEIQAKVHDFK